MGEQDDALIDVNTISLFINDPITGRELDTPHYETFLDTAIRECEATQFISICDLVELFDNDDEIGAKRYAELSEEEKQSFAPLPEMTSD